MDFLDIFGQLDDPRIERKKLHPHARNTATDVVCCHLRGRKLG